MPRPAARLILILALSCLVTPLHADSPPAPGAAAIEARARSVIDTLASPEFAGRSGTGARRAEKFLVEHFRSLGLQPAFDGQFTQDIPERPGGPIIGRNVAAVLRGSDPKLADEWVLVSAHYDHLGVQRGVLYPGADDNASGVAMMLEIARGLAEDPQPPPRSVMFIGFDLEELGLLGSRHFVAEPPIDLDSIRLFITADLVGGSLGGVCRDHLFVLGTEHAPMLGTWLEEAAQGTSLALAPLGSDVLMVSRSDYGPFRSRKVPFLFFSTGEDPEYHTPQDRPETIDYPKLRQVTTLVDRVARRVASAPTVPGWTDPPVWPTGELAALQSVLGTLLDHREKLGISGTQEIVMKRAVSDLQTVLDRGQPTPEERTKFVRIAQFVLFTVL